MPNGNFDLKNVDLYLNSVKFQKMTKYFISDSKMCFFSINKNYTKSSKQKSIKIAEIKENNNNKK